MPSLTLPPLQQPKPKPSFVPVWKLDSLESFEQDGQMINPGASTTEEKPVFTNHVEKFSILINGDNGSISFEESKTGTSKVVGEAVGVISNNLVSVAETFGKVAPEAAKVTVDSVKDLLFQDVLGLNLKPKEKPGDEKKKMEQTAEFNFKLNRNQSLQSEIKKVEQENELKEQNRFAVAFTGSEVKAKESGYLNKNFNKVDSVANRAFTLIKRSWDKAKETAKNSLASIGDAVIKGTGVFRQDKIAEGGSMLSSTGGGGIG